MANILSPASRTVNWLQFLLTISTLWLMVQPVVLAQTGKTIWRLGKIDNSTAEFANYTAGNPEAVNVPADWATRSDWSFMPKGLKGTVNPAMTLSFDLESVPSNGVLFSFKLLHADRVAPEMAVFSNGTMAGLIQLYGSGNAGVNDRWKKTYQLYIPKEMLQAGPNVLRLEAPRSYYASSAIDQYLYWEWDFLNLTALTTPATEPIHGKMTYMGSAMRPCSDCFSINDNNIAPLPNMLKWMGIAYSGNTMRANFDEFIPAQQPRRKELLEIYRDHNMTVSSSYVDPARTSRFDGNGYMTAFGKTKVDTFLLFYGNMVQYYELNNEPSIFNRPKSSSLALARYLNQVRPAHLKVLSPGWAFQGGRGTPAGWERDPLHRSDVELLSQAINGHSYGQGYTDRSTGSFLNMLKTFGTVPDGWAKEYVNTETGTQNTWTDFTFTGASQPNAAMFDRIMRAHVAVVDRFMQHATSFGSFSLFIPNSDPTLLAAYAGVNGQDTRLKTYRRLALAYATHGAPLKYTYLNKADITGKKVYFRGVNTATLAPLPGSGGTSNKLLLNFVNFESTPQTMAVKVTLPGCGATSGERVSEGNSYSTAFSAVNLTTDAAGTLTLDVTLPPGESVQYILNPPTGTCATATTFPAGTEKITLEAEDGQLMAPMQTQTDDKASAARFIAAPIGTDSRSSAPATGIASYSFIVADAGNFRIWGRVAAPDKNSDSFWVKVDNGNWVKWNKAAQHSGKKSKWVWSFVRNGVAEGVGPLATFDLVAGAHTLQIAYNEGGAKLDQLLLSSNPDYVPGGNEETPIADEQLPAAPTNLVASAVTFNSAQLTWTPATDNVGVTGYDIYYGPVLAGSVEATTGTFSLTGLSYDSPYTYTVRARDAAYNHSPASNPVSFLTGRLPRPDLVVTNISTSPEKIVGGQRVSMRATVKNQGLVSTPAGTIVGAAFRVSGISGVHRYARRYDRAIAPNESVELVADSVGTGQTAWRPLTPGSFTLTAQVDTEDRVSEMNDDNNTYSEVFTVAPTAVEATSMAAPANRTVYKETQPVAISVVSTMSGIEKIEFYANGIKIGETLTSPYTMTWTPPGVDTYGIHAIMYKGGVVVETGSVTIMVDPAFCDLIVTDITWTPANPVVGQGVRFSAIVKNQGLKPSPDNVITGAVFRIKRGNSNTNLTWSDTYNSAIQPGQSITITANNSPDDSGIYLPTAARIDTVEAFVDDVNRIKEELDNNNTLRRFMTVAAPGGRVGAEARTSELDVTLYPVPVQDMLIVEARQAIKSVELTTVLGQTHAVRYRHLLPHKVEVDLRESPVGVYLVRVKLSEGILTKKIIIQH